MQQLEADAEQVRLIVSCAPDLPPALLEKTANRLVQAGIKREKLLLRAEQPVSEPVERPTPGS